MQTFFFFLMSRISEILWAKFLIGVFPHIDVLIMEPHSTLFALAFGLSLKKLYAQGSVVK